MSPRSGPRRRPAAGFSLLESLIASAVFFIAVLAGLDFIGTARTVFFRLQTAQDIRQAAWAGMDRIRTDLLRAGGGLLHPIRSGLVTPVEAAGPEGTLVLSREEFALAADVPAGGTALSAEGAGSDLAGRLLCLHDGVRGEIAGILSSGSGLIILAAPLRNSYRAGDTALSVLQHIRLSWDPVKAVLRRRIDQSPAQPLLEDVTLFSMIFDPASSTAALRLAFAGAPEKVFESRIHVPNAALAGAR